jgi:glutamate 5-kinase
MDNEIQSRENIKIVVKVEITTLLNSNGKFNKRKMERLAMLLTNLMSSGIQIVIVSSGAIFLGSAKLGLANQPEVHVKKQAIAAVGQVELMRYYRYFFDMYNQMVAQVLLTSDVIKDPVRNRNARNTLTNLLTKRIIPIVNENDSVSTDDIELDDNYYMVLNVASLIDAELVLVKSVEDSRFLLVLRKNYAENLIVGENEIIATVNEIKHKISYGNYLLNPFPADFKELDFY